MIARLAGKVIDKLADRIVLDVNGVGYEVFMPATSLARIGAAGSSLVVHTVTHVREDALLLFGFLAFDEKHLFETLTGVSGVGPKLALAILSGLTPAALRGAVARRDLAALTQVSGIGRKTAERLLVELRDRVGEDVGGELDASGEATPFQDAVTALITLGYARPQAVSAVRDAAGELAPDAAPEHLVRRALGRLVSSRSGL
ncbi:MAG TPA: Holliday junction branch migration protein RuvA [Candidatus Eisenbacteria bacterium]